MTAFHLRQERDRAPGAPSSRGGATSRYADGPERSRRWALVMLPALFLLGGCGQRGALFLPGENEEGEEARQTPTSVSVA